MAYGLKLYYEWTSRTGIRNKVEIRDRDKVDDSGTIEVSGLDGCFEVEYPKCKLGYEAIRSCGARLSFLYKGAEGFLDDFFTPDLQKFKVIHYQDGTTNFLGYLNTELYDEDYSVSTNVGVEVELTANNGLAILDRINYIKSSGEFYYGIDNVKTIFKRIFDVVNLEYQNLYFTPLFDLVIDDVGTLSGDYLGDQYINNANWIDEDFETSSLKDILENLLLSNGLQLITYQDDVYILPIDRQAKALSTNSFFHYTLPDFAKQSNKSIDLSPLEITNVGYFKGGQVKGKVTAINSQEIEYDPYSIDDDVINGEVDQDDYFINQTNTATFGSGDYAWTKEFYEQHTNFVKGASTTYPAKFVKAYKTNEPKKNKSYIEITPRAVTTYGGGNWAVETKPIPVYIINGCKLKISIEQYMQTADNWEGDPDDKSLNTLASSPSESGCEIYVRSGNYAYNKNTKKFDTYFDPSSGIGVPGSIERECLIRTFEPFDDWTPIVQTDTTLKTENIIEFEYDADVSPTNNIVVGITPRVNGYRDYIDFIRIYEVKVSIYDEVSDKHGVDLSELVKSSEIQLDATYKNKGEKIETKVGTILQEPEFRITNPNQRGAMFYSADDVNYRPIAEFKKDGVSSPHSEFWVLKQVVDNYSTPSNTLKATFNAYNLMRPVIDSTFMSNVKMIATGGVYDYYNDSFQTHLQQIKEMV